MDKDKCKIEINSEDDAVACLLYMDDSSNVKDSPYYDTIKAKLREGYIKLGEEIPVERDTPSESTIHVFRIDAYAVDFEGNMYLNPVHK